MARWTLVMKASLADHGAEFPSLIAFFSTLLLFSVCITMLLALCAAHSHSLQLLNVRRESPNNRSSLAIAAPEEFKRQELSFNFGSNTSSSGNSATSVLPKLSSASAALTKLGSSFRISSFRDSSFRISSFRVDSCKQVDGVLDSLRRVRPAGPEEEGEDDSTEPAVWQRVILRGERCSPLSFSGLILYDENGNQLPRLCEDDDDDEDDPKHTSDMRKAMQPTMESRLRTSQFGSSSR